MKARIYADNRCVSDLSQQVYLKLVHTSSLCERRGTFKPLRHSFVNAREIVGEILGFVAIFEIGVLEMLDKSGIIENRANVAIIITSRRTLLLLFPVKLRWTYHQPGRLICACNLEWNKQ